MEEWKTIPNYPHYDVSNHGRVRSYKIPGHQGKTLAEPQRILKPALSGRYKNYLVVCLANQDGPKTFHVHRLVTTVFLGPCPDGLEVCHNDGNPQNNHISNLRYDTRSENAKDMYRQGLRPSNCKLSDKQVEEMRTLCKQGWNKKQLAEHFSITMPTVELACTGRTYKWVGGPISSRPLPLLRSQWKPRKLTFEDVRQIRLERTNGVLLSKLAAKYGVTEATISRTARHKTWAGA